LDGSFWKYWQARVSAELTTTSDGKFLKYAYLNCSYLPDLQLRVGQMKVPFSREYLTSFADVDTIERAMITDSGGTVPKYDIGIMLHGPKVLNGTINYGLGVFNGNAANNNDTNDDKDFIGRLVLAPFVSTDATAVKGLEIGASYQFGRQTDGNKTTSTSYKFQPKLPTDWAFYQEIKHRGERERLGLDMVYKIGRFKLQAEYIYQRLAREKQVRINPATNRIVSSGGKLIDAPDFIAQGWYVLGTYFVWGDEKKGVQLVARYEQMDVDDEEAAEKYQTANPMGKNVYDVEDGIVTKDNRYGNALNLRGNSADILTLGFNYFPMPHVRLAFNWLYQTLDNKYTTDKIVHDHDGGEVLVGRGGAMNAFYFLTQVKW
jgi:phosphate-selective porin